MPKPDLPMEGSCRCGATRIRITAPPLMTAACHCRGCQKMAASAFSLTAMVPTEGFEVIGTVPEAFESRSRGRVGLHVMHRYL